MIRWSSQDEEKVKNQNFKDSLGFNSKFMGIWMYSQEFSTFQIKIEILISYPKWHFNYLSYHKYIELKTE